SNTAEYGDYISGKRVVNQETRQEMKKILTEIQSGEFAKRWILENQANRPVYNALARQEREHLIEKTGAALRKMMPWLRKS
ncbi:MAG: ketol-acid reductoisomerase, partial [Peptococcaceae bacterium]